MARADDLRADYDRLGVLLADCDAKEAAGLARERRMIGELLDALEAPAEVTLVDQLAGNVVPLESRGGTETKPAGASSRRRKSG